MADLSIEIRNMIYDVLGVVTGVVSIALCILHGKKFKYPLKTSVLICAVWYCLVFCVVSQQWMTLDRKLLGYGSVTAFRSILLLPIVALPLSRIAKTHTLDICDYVTPFYFFCHGFATIACWICGCCAGCEWPFGIVNPKSGLTVFPTQPLIIVCCMVITVITLMYDKKHNYSTRGKTYAIGLIIYGVFRYALEFFSDDPRIFDVLSLYSIYAIIMVLLGLMILYFSDNPIKYPAKGVI